MQHSDTSADSEARQAPLESQAASRRGFLYAAVAAGVTGRAALASRLRVVEESQRDFEFEGRPATEFIVRPESVGAFGNPSGGAIELSDPSTGESILVPLFDLSVLTESKFEDGLKAAIRAHGDWHGEQGRSAPAVHIHLVRVAGHPNLRALLVHPRRCVLPK